MRPVFHDLAAGRVLRGGALAGVLLALAACDLDLTDPNSPDETTVLNTPALVLTTAVGLQAQYAENVLVFVRAPALVSDEWGTRQRALPADRSLITGDIDPGYGVISDPFAAAYRIARTSDLLIENAPRVNLGPGTQAGITALAKLMKAMAIGNLTLQYREMPLNFDPTGAVPSPRAEVRANVIALLESARGDLAGVTDAQLTEFNAAVLGANAINLRNTIDAMLARYYLFAGQDQAAIAAAERVNLGVLSQLPYPNPGQNPIFQYGQTGLDYVGIRKVFFTEAEPGDQRVAFWGVRNAGVAGVPDSVFNFNRYGTRNESFPLYLPDEMRLIRAEAHTRRGELDLARTLVNQVRTQCSSAVNEPVACLPALPESAMDTAEKLYAEILRQRRYELFAQGLRWEDLRRLGAFTTVRPTVEFLPYPSSECARNPAISC
jgi:starch-binding outer membrane protein, SusD/RagB family